MTEISWKVRPLTEHDARAMATWTYPEPYSFYSSDPEDAERFLNPAYNYVAVVDGNDELVAHLCFGADARVPGGKYNDEGAIDFGLGVRPDLIGQGNGAMLIELAICEVQRRWKRRPMRATVASFNERVTHLMRKFRFREVEIFRNPSGREFVVFIGR